MVPLKLISLSEPDFPPPKEYVRMCTYPNTARLRDASGKFIEKGWSILSLLMNISDLH